MRLQIGAVAMENSVELLKKLKIELPCDQQFHHLVYIWKK